MSEEPRIASIEPQVLYELSRHQAIDLLDVSTPVEHAELRVRFAHNAPIGSEALEARMRERRPSANRPLYVMCRGGVRSVKVCKQYPDLGLVNVTGGTRLWVERGLPVARDHDVLSLERQASLAAGLILVASGVLGLLVAPAALAASVAVGTLLVVAGAADRPFLEIVMSKMPWNNVSRPRARTAQ